MRHDGDISESHELPEPATDNQRGGGKALRAKAGAKTAVGRCAPTPSAMPPPAPACALPEQKQAGSERQVEGNRNYELPNQVGRPPT